jgi:hypothetical protein
VSWYRRVQGPGTRESSVIVKESSVYWCRRVKVSWYRRLQCPVTGEFSVLVQDSPVSWVKRIQFLGTGESSVLV